MKKKIIKNEIVVYQLRNGAIELKKDIGKNTIWATQAQIVQLFAVDQSVASRHIKNIFKDKEISLKSNMQKMHIANSDKPVVFYSLDVILAVGYRANSTRAIIFRQWATKTLRAHITKGYTINPSRIKSHYTEFIQAVDEMKNLLPPGGAIDSTSVLELVSAFADTWVSLEAYDKDKLTTAGVTKKAVALTAEQLYQAIGSFKKELAAKGEATDLFAAERQKASVAGIVGNVMQSFGGKPVYPTVEEKAAHLLYFIVKNHPFIDGNKRSGAYAFVWFLKKAGILDASKITPLALTALTLFVAESDSKNKERMIRLILQLLKK
ncbi:MAG: death-on-curing protein [Candidatus Komeilibacteria bacterium RIFCSPLOWO2_02_FULL_48_11]|uniref:Death-on-curing protein n=1 Tax=Candidatus Komeilibacteria bacterium RIFCSPLOWO2_02_FULL_48_11 TaxID=1798553 RepID=A0A1G2BVT7_9BACT|nr:MAG: death-on-curing protein [Candidatus Komeilibacteria bacterium RIFCSPLOWO2_02_FULL_48_11]